MFRIYFTNFDYFSQETFSSAEAAIAYGRSKGFEFSVYDRNERVGHWTVFGGWRESKS